MSNPFAEFDRRMARACKAERARAAAAGDKQAFVRAQAELGNYGKMLAEDVKRCGCGWNCPALKRHTRYSLKTEQEAEHENEKGAVLE